MKFNGRKPKIIHLDINSCFATIEQQANPFLRNKPLVVVAYNSPNGCVLASSIEGKKLGIKTGMRLSEGKKIYPELISLTPDPPKYRDVHKKIKNILDDYSPKVIPKSIDEFVFEPHVAGSMQNVACEIKQRIKNEVGEYITVSVGISTNRYLAKIASNLQKPDGLEEINKQNFASIYSKLKLTDLTGIKYANKRRLNSVGIESVLEFYSSPIWKLRLAFGGIIGLYWYLRLRGLEIDPSAGSGQVRQKTFGNSYAPRRQLANKNKEILSKLCEKTGFRLRSSGFYANGVYLSILFRNGMHWHKGTKTKQTIFESRDIYNQVLKLLAICPIKETPRIIAINVFNLVKNDSLQLNFFENLIKKQNLTASIDQINNKWGDFTIYPARMITDPKVVQDRISFGQL